MAEKVTKTDEEWRAQLSDLAYKVTREHATERAFSHAEFPKGPATFTCVCCGAPLFDAEAKFDSGCGWPSFTAPVSETVVEEQADDSWFMRRTEVHCAACDAHLGHVFPDGPGPTGLRYCINGVALDHKPKT
ncbi:MAG: peptide-methionine (R)-S-oxide reductase MsrB [Albidovulum sp.]